jgi:hypothetical protein
MKEILRRELGPKKFSRRSVPHLVSDQQKKLRVDASRKLLSVLGMYAEHNFEGITIRDKYWFQYSSYSDSIFADSRESFVPRVRRDISGQQLWLQFSLHLRHFWCQNPYQKVRNSIRIISLTRYFQGCTMKGHQFHAKTSSQPFQFRWIIPCVMIITSCPRNFPREALNELHTHRILQT